MPWWFAIAVNESRIEATQAGIAGGTCNHRDRQRRFRQQLLGEQQATRCCEIERAGSHFLGKQPAQMTLADTNARCECGYRCAIQRAFIDQSQRATHQFGSRTMRRSARCSFGTAAQAWAETCRRCRARGFVVTHVSCVWRRRGTDRTAIDSGRLHRRVEHAVEPCITSQPRSLVNSSRGVRRGKGFRHARSVAVPTTADSPFSAIHVGAGQNPLRKNPPSTAMHSPVT